MKKLILLSLLVIGFTSCETEPPIPLSPIKIVLQKVSGDNVEYIYLDINGEENLTSLGGVNGNYTGTLEYRRNFQLDSPGDVLNLRIEFSETYYEDHASYEIYKVKLNDPSVIGNDLTYGPIVGQKLVEFTVGVSNPIYEFTYIKE